MEQQLTKHGKIVKLIPGYQDYFITEDGEVWSDVSNKWLSINIGKMGKGYKRTALNLDKWLIHRLVGLAWVDNPDNKKTINHIDGNTFNNHYTNLEWCTQKENVQHSWVIGTSVRNEYHNSNENNPRAKLTNEQVAEIRASELSSRKLAAIYKIGHGTIAKIKRFERYKTS